MTDKKDTLDAIPAEFLAYYTDLTEKPFSEYSEKDDKTHYTNEFTEFIFSAMVGLLYVYEGSDVNLKNKKQMLKKGEDAWKKKLN